MENILEFLIKPYRDDYSTLQIGLEIMAVLLGIISVWCAKNRNILVFPTGIISTTIFIYLLFNWQLYGDMMINFYYTLMSLYGWFLWNKKSEDSVHVKIQKTTKNDVPKIIGLFVFSTIFVLTIYHFKPIISNNFNLENLANCNFNYSWIEYTDTVTTAIFLVGMWLMAKRRIENWLFWIVGNSISIPMYLVKGYGITSLQYCIFLVLAILGYLVWKKELKTAKKVIS